MVFFQFQSNIQPNKYSLLATSPSANTQYGSIDKITISAEATTIPTSRWPKMRIGGGGNEGRHQASIFYADDNMVALSDPRWLRWVFDTLVGLFVMVVLWTNVGKIVSMVCKPWYHG